MTIVGRATVCVPSLRGNKEMITAVIAETPDVAGLRVRKCIYMVSHHRREVEVPAPVS